MDSLNGTMIQINTGVKGLLKALEEKSKSFEQFMKSLIGDDSEAEPDIDEDGEPAMRPPRGPAGIWSSMYSVLYMFLTEALARYSQTLYWQNPSLYFMFTM